MASLDIAWDMPAANMLWPWCFPGKQASVIKHQADILVPHSSVQIPLCVPKIPNSLYQVSFLPLCKQFGKWQIFIENLLFCLFSAWSDNSLSEGPMAAMKIRKQRDYTPDDKKWGGEGSLNLTCPCLILFKAPTLPQGQFSAPDLVHKVLPSLLLPTSLA